MIGSFLTRALVLVLGYAYPAYECYKIVELNKPEIEQLRFWCQYWILVAALTIFERVGDTFISWVPMYSEAKLAFFVYLWYPKTKGTTYVYDTFFRPYVAKHENEIDHNLLELKTWAGDNFILYWQKAANYGQTRFFEILEYVASQSTSQSSRPRPAQRQQPQQTRQAPSAVAAGRQPTTSHQPPQPAAPGRQPAASHQPQQPARATSSPTKTQLQESTKVGIPQLAAPPGAQTQTSSVPVILRSLETPGPPAESKETMHIEVPSAPPNEGSNPPSQERLMEEAIRVTRGRSRRRAAGAAGPSTH